MTGVQTCALPILAIFVEGRQLNPEYYDVSVKDLLERLNSPARMHLLVEIRKQDLRPLYNHMARDIYYLEGIDVVENPFVSCQILSQNTRFAEVLFKNDIGKLRSDLRKENGCS